VAVDARHYPPGSPAMAEGSLLSAGVELEGTTPASRFPRQPQALPKALVPWQPKVLCD
jgi:hypothetical protein